MSLDKSKTRMGELLKLEQIVALQKVAFDSDYEKALKQRRKQEKKAFFTMKAMRGRAK